MSRIIVKTLGWTLLAALAFSVVLIAAVVSAIGPLTQTAFSFDGQSITLAELGAEHWLLLLLAVMLALVVAMLIVLLVVPTALAVALLCAAAAITPLLVFIGLVWLIWRLARDSAPGAGATIAR
ncbi:MAG: hypothetical protein ABI887_19950 [Burkholderiales bacterium]